MYKNLLLMSLVLSGAVEAQSFFCTVDRQAYTTPSSMSFLQKDDEIQDITPYIGSRSYLVNTEFGWKPIFDAGRQRGVDADMAAFGGKEWKGSCFNNMGFIVCNNGNDPFEIFSINPIKLLFSYTYNYAGAAAIARSGTCVKT